MQWQGVFFVTRLRRHLHSVTQEVAAAMFIFLMARISTEQFLIFYRRTDTCVWRTRYFWQVSGGHVVALTCVWRTLCLWYVP